MPYDQMGNRPKGGSPPPKPPDLSRYVSLYIFPFPPSLYVPPPLPTPLPPIPSATRVSHSGVPFSSQHVRLSALQVAGRRVEQEGEGAGGRKRSERRLLQVSVGHVMSCYIRHVMSCRAMSCHVMSCHVTSCHVMSCHVMWCHAASCHVTSCHVMSCHVVSCRVVLCPVLSCSS